MGGAGRGRRGESDVKTVIVCKFLKKERRKEEGVKKEFQVWLELYESDLQTFSKNHHPSCHVNFYLANDQKHADGLWLRTNTIYLAFSAYAPKQFPLMMGKSTQQTTQVCKLAGDERERTQNKEKPYYQMHFTHLSG